MAFAFVALFPRRLSGDGDVPSFGHVGFDDEGLEMLRRLHRLAWFTCGPCYGTGWQNYKEWGKGTKVDCTRCDGLGRVRLAG